MANPLLTYQMVLLATKVQVANNGKVGDFDCVVEHQIRESKNI